MKHQCVQVVDDGWTMPTNNHPQSCHWSLSAPSEVCEMRDSVNHQLNPSQAKSAACCHIDHKGAEYESNAPVCVSGSGRHSVYRASVRFWLACNKSGLLGVQREVHLDVFQVTTVTHKFEDSFCIGTLFCAFSRPKVALLWWDRLGHSCYVLSDLSSQVALRL